MRSNSNTTASPRHYLINSISKTRFAHFELPSLWKSRDSLKIWKYNSHSKLISYSCHNIAYVRGKRRVYKREARQYHMSCLSTESSESAGCDDINNMKMLDLLMTSARWESFSPLTCWPSPPACSSWWGYWAPAPSSPSTDNLERPSRGGSPVTHWTRRLIY